MRLRLVNRETALRIGNLCGVLEAATVLPLVWDGDIDSQLFRFVVNGRPVGLAHVKLDNRGEFFNRENLDRSRLGLLCARSMIVEKLDR